MDESHTKSPFEEKKSMFEGFSRPQSSTLSPKKIPPPVPQKVKRNDQCETTVKNSDKEIDKPNMESENANVMKINTSSKSTKFMTAVDSSIPRETFESKTSAQKIDSTDQQHTCTAKSTNKKLKEINSPPTTLKAPSTEYKTLSEKLKQKEKEMLTQLTELEISEHNRSASIIDNVLFSKASSDQIDLLLIGKTGNGKSALGNTILGHKAFESRPSLQSVTTNVTYDVSERQGVLIKVVDGPGIGDTRMDTAEATYKILQAMSKAISLSPKGYHAFLLVVKFGVRFTAEDKDTVDTLKKIFGENFFKRFFIIVMTCGDKFDEEVKTDFNEWVVEQSNGVFGVLLNECNGRILLFDNRTQDKAKQKKQLGDLLKAIDDLKKQNCRYTDEHFNIATITRHSLMLEAQKELIEEEIMNEANLIQQRLEYILGNVKCQKSTPFLKDILERANVLYRSIREKDKGTGILHELTQHVWSLINTIRDQKKLSEYMKERKEKFIEKKKQEVERRVEEMKSKREEFEKDCIEGPDDDKKKCEMLQKQIEEMNEQEEECREQSEELESELNAAWDEKRQNVEVFGENLKKLKEKQVMVTEEKISNSVFSRMKRFFSRKSSIEEKENSS